MSCRCLYLLNTSLYRTLFFFFFNDTATTEIYTLSLHDALPISLEQRRAVRARQLGMELAGKETLAAFLQRRDEPHAVRDRKSTRLNSSHLVISYAVFCLKKKKYIATRVGGLLYADLRQLAVAVA